MEGLLLKPWTVNNINNTNTLSSRILTTKTKTCYCPRFNPASTHLLHLCSFRVRLRSANQGKYQKVRANQGTTESNSEEEDDDDDAENTDNAFSVKNNKNKKLADLSSDHNEDTGYNDKHSLSQGYGEDKFPQAEIDLTEDETKLLLQGAKPLPLAISIGLGLGFFIFVPRPETLTPQSWQLLSIFISTITGLILSPLPVGAWAFLVLTLSVVTGTLPFSVAFSAFTNDVIWLVVISFFFARGFVKTGLGDRVATLFVKMMGSSTLGLSYGLIVSEAIIAPAMPSTTARAGGVFLPIIQSLSLSAGSRPNDSSAKKLGGFLIQSQIQAAGHSSALFFTAAAQNLLCLKLAEELGVVFKNPWIQWFEAASLPGLVGLLATPLILYKLSPPDVKDTPDAPAIATRKLQEMGPITDNEWTMIATMLIAITLWIFGDQIGVTSVETAMLGLSTLLLLGVLSWDDCLNEKMAWDTLAWFSVLVGLASQLTNLGIVQWLSALVAKYLISLSFTWPVSFCILQALYFFVHYLFASQTGHVGALYSAFLAMHLVAGVPAVLAALTLSFNTSLFGALTHYSSGQAAVYYGAGYVELPEIFRTGFVCGLLNLTIWGVIGIGWWKFLDLY